ncbi:MAG: nickel-dependent hydrogenase large subunit [Candidatus Bathyarchaeota archaeon]
MERKTQTVLPIGPFFATLEEPVHFRLYVDGEKVTGADVIISYNHRGIEKLAESRTYHQVIYLTERICGICNLVHPTAYIQAAEEIAKVELPDRARYLRTIIQELERIHSHLLWIGLAFHFMALDTIYMHVWKDREIVMSLLERITGNRVNKSYLTIGGVRRDIKKDEIPKITEILIILEAAVKKYVKIALEDRTIKARLQGVGILTPQKAREFSVTGPTARGSGLTIDVRKDDPYAAYKDVSFDVVTQSEGDVWSKAVVRLFELVQSVIIIRQCIDQMPSGDIAVPVGEIPPGEGIGRAEAPRGEVFHYLKSNGSNIPERLKIRAPSYVNIPSTLAMLPGNLIADAPLIIASVDPCISCTCRVVDLKSNNQRIFSMEEFAKFSQKRKRNLIL